MSSWKERLIEKGWIKNPNDPFLKPFREQIAARKERLRDERRGIKPADIANETEPTPDGRSSLQDRGK
jgi:hypothetical protein